MIVLTCAQRSVEWYAARCGKVCSSDANDMLSTIKSGEAAGRRNLRAKLMLERVMGKSLESDYLSQAMQNGIDREAMALSLYEARTGLLLEHAGFIQHDLHQAGWSPDGYTDDGFVEAKSPEAATHLETLKTRLVPTKYLRQMIHGGFWIGGKLWGDYVSYQPDFPEPLQLFIKRLHRQDFNIQAHEDAVIAFLAEVDAEVETVRRLIPVESAVA
jgi:YqaJ-like recombinase protein